MSLAWMNRAACAPDIYFTDKTSDEQKAVCADCPVRVECLDYGVEVTQHTYPLAKGSVVYGGLTLAELRQARKARA